MSSLQQKNTWAGHWSGVLAHERTSFTKSLSGFWDFRMNFCYVLVLLLLFKVKTIGRPQLFENKDLLCYQPFGRIFTGENGESSFYLTTGWTWKRYKIDISLLIKSTLLQVPVFIQWLVLVLSFNARSINFPSVYLCGLDVKLISALNCFIL